MQITFRLPVEGSPDIVLVHSPWTNRIRVTIQGVELPGTRRGRIRYYSVAMPDGTTAELQLRNSGIDVLPRATVVFGDPPKSVAVLLARPLAWWEYLLSGLPILLVPVGGLIGGLVGGMAAYFNLRMMRSGLPAPLRVLAALAVLAAAAVVYVLLAVGFAALVQGGR